MPELEITAGRTQTFVNTKVNNIMSLETLVNNAGHNH